MITGLNPSLASHVCPGPSSPVGHKIVLISLKFGSSDEGAASICAPCKGIGTREEENGVAPGENVTFGLLVPLTVMLLPNAVMNDPEKKRLDADEFVVMERTSLEPPPNPPKGGADHEFESVLHIATDDAGDEKRPPTHTRLFGSSQKMALTSPFGASPEPPRALND